MPTCDVCGNEYDNAFSLTTPQGDHGTYDSFECAIHAVAPRCEHCGCAVIGHGVHAEGRVYCCSHCARTGARVDLADHP